MNRGMMPLEAENRFEKIFARMIHEKKWGIYMADCIILLNILERSSSSRRVSIIGTGKPKRNRRKLIYKVLNTYRGSSRFSRASWKLASPGADEAPHFYAVVFENYQNAVKGNITEDKEVGHPNGHHEVESLVRENPGELPFGIEPCFTVYYMFVW
jgi:hypothetical protein